MVRPTGWDILGLDGDPTPGVVESVQALAKEFGDFAHDVESAYRSLNSFGSDAAALEWVGQTADAFKSNYGPLPGRLQKLYTSYSEASDALSAYAPKLQAAQSKADLALRQAQDAHADLQRATTNATNAAADLKTAQQNHAASPNPQAVTDAQTAHDTAQTSLNNAKARMTDLARQAEDAYDDRITAAKDCAKAIGHAQSDGIHNKHWWEHIGADLAEWGGKIAEIANDLAPFLDVLALATSWIPGVDVITAGLAEADNLIALAGTGLEIAGDAMQGHWGDALMGAGMLGLTFLGGKAIGSLGGKLAGRLGREAEEGAEGAAGAEARTAEGNGPAICKDDPIDVVSGWMLTDETDLTLPGTLPVVLRRAYSSGYGMGRLFGPGWASTMDQRLSVNEAGVHFAGDDAQRLDYPVPGQGEDVLPGRGNRWPLSWDREADEIRIFDPFTGIARHFATVHYQDEHGQIRDLTAISDRNGNRINFLRDARGTPIAVEHPAYRIDVDTVLTATGPRIAGLRLHDGTENGIDVKKFSYDERGRLTGVVDSSDLPLRYTWDDSDRITAWIDRVGYRYVYEYDALGRVVRTSGDGGFMSGTFVYDIDGRTTVHTSSLGNATIFRYDDAGHVLSETDPLGNTVFTEYDLEGRLLRRTDALGNSSVYEIDERGDTIAGRRPDGTAVVAEYTSLHKVAVIRLPDGAEWHRHYDHRGNLLTVTDPTGATTTFEYGDRGVLLSAADALGAVTGYETNPAGLPLTLVDPLGAVTHLVRDAFGRVVRVTDPMGAVTECAWTVEGRPTWRVEPDGGRTEWAYDAEGRLLSLTSPGGAVTAYENGPFGTVTARMEADGNRYEFAFDAELRPIRVTNAAGAAWSYAHDLAGRLVSETDFIGRTVDYVYDASGRMRLRTDAAGGRVEFERDTNGLVARRRIPDGEFGYEYDAMGRLLRATGPGSEIVYARDAAGRVVSETVDGRTTAYEFDRAGRRVRRTTPAGVTSTWTYDAAGRPAALQAGGTELSFLHDAAGREVERAFAGGARLERRLDAAGRLGGLRLWAGDRSGASGPDAAASERLVFGREWDYRSDGIPVEIRDSLSGTRRYTADSVGRVQGVDAGTWTESYAYDAFGNLSQAASSLDGDANGTAVFETERTLIRQAGRTRYEHDAAGRLVRAVRRTLDGRRKVWAYSWDGEDRLVQVVTPDGATWHYSYDPLGRRTAKTRISPDGVETERVAFVWDGVRLAEQSAVDADATVTTLTWDYEPGTFAPAAQRRRSRGADAEQRVVDEAFYAIITDLAGAPTELVTADGRIAWRTVTGLWGRTLSTTADHGTDCPLRFAGQYHDTETGLHYNLNRYYDPDTAAYLSPDPLGLAPAPNDHAYVVNPLTWIDPLGLACVKTDTGLGFQGHGAKEWAEKNGFQHYMSEQYQDTWQGAVRSDLGNPAKTIHVLTEGFGPEGFEGMAVAGLKPGAKATEQEMGWAARSVIHGQRSWDSIHFYDKNGRIFPDEPQWYDPKWEKAWILEEV
ncbi:RHS repeat-associated protein [Catenulispora sp. MAP12-49]|uniref:RHS repeat-associated core domain-containing protein n=1 Tax=Catenulispora sp. MAP12-49 TaxID=3156302 RepID=UPI0035123C3F